MGRELLPDARTPAPEGKLARQPRGPVLQNGLEDDLRGRRDGIEPALEPGSLSLAPWPPA